MMQYYWIQRLAGTSRSLAMLLMVLAAVLAIVREGHAAEGNPTALEVLERADDHWDLNLRNSRVELELAVYRENELRTTYRMILKYQDTYHVLAETIYPPRNEGEKMLQAGRKNYWLYLPNVNKAVKISESNSLSNSDFSNTDLLSPRLSQEYVPRLVGTETLFGTETYKLELQARDESSPYAKITYWVRKSDYAPLRRDYFTFSGQLLKRLDMRSTSKGMNGMPDTFVMSSVLEKDKKTVLRYLSYQPHVGYKPDTFSPESLMKR